MVWLLSVISPLETAEWMLCEVSDTHHRAGLRVIRVKKNRRAGSRVAVVGISMTPCGLEELTPEEAVRVNST